MHPVFLPIPVQPAVDTTPPTLIGCPSSSVRATAPAGQMSTEVVLPVITASDNSDPNPSVVQSHSSGDVFNVGTTQVTVTATDASGNQATCSFNVVVTAGKSVA